MEGGAVRKTSSGRRRGLELFDAMLPTALRNAPPETCRRARLTVFCCTVSAVTHAATFFSMWSQEVYWVAAGNATAAVPSALLPLLLRFGVRLPWVANGIVAVQFFFVVGTAGASGGEAIAALHTLAIIPGIAILLSGRGALVGWTSATIAFLAVLAALRTAGFEFPVSLPAERTALAKFPGVIALTFGIATFALLYEWVKDRALEELAQARRHSEGVEREQRQLETRLADTQKLESLGVLAGGVAHDFNNLLTTILGHASLIQEAPDRPREELAELAGQIVLASEQAADLTDQLLAYTGRGWSVREPVDLAEIVRRVEPLARTGLTPDVELRLELSDRPTRVIADPGQLQQVVLNLVTNAAQAISGRGRILVRTAVLDPTAAERAGLEPVQEGAGANEDGWAALEVEDDGAGMTPDIRARMFDPFFTTKEIGRGLGLSALLGIVRSHGGAVHVESRPGAGSRIAVHLPATRQAASSRIDREAGAGALRIEGSAVVADDDEAVRGFAARTLASMGFRVREARDGSEALGAAEAEPDLRIVVLDDTMPGISGSHVLAQLAKERPGLPVILSSGHPEGFARVARDQPNVVWLPKPYRAEALRGAVARALGDPEDPPRPDTV